MRQYRLATKAPKMPATEMVTTAESGTTYIAKPTLMIPVTKVVGAGIAHVASTIGVVARGVLQITTTVIVLKRATSTVGITARPATAIEVLAQLVTLSTDPSAVV